MRPGGIAQYIAEKGYVAIVINDGGGTSMAPPGGYEPTLGTNPVAYGIPTEKEPLVVDMATSKRALGQIRLANKYGTDLPADTFYNNKGELILNPKEAYSVLPFGEHKGFALALLIEILCGSLIGMDMFKPSDAGSFYGRALPDRGAIIIVFDPSQSTNLEEFKKANSHLLNKLKATKTLKGQKIRIPGEKAGQMQQESLKEGYVDLPDELWQELQNLS